jgi:hypothetical protein
VSDRRIKWAAGREDRFKEYAEVEIQAALSARASLENRWRQFLEQYRAPANQPTKHFPFEGASNYVMPVTAIDVDQLYAKFVQTIHAPANLWTTEALNPKWTDAAKPMQDYLQWLDGAILRMEDVNKRALLEMVKLGTCIYKTDWLFERRRVGAYDENGKRVQVERTVSHPIVDHVRLIDFLIPSYAYTIQPDDQGGAPWVAERHRVRVARLESIADASEPYMPNYGPMAVEKIRQWLQPAQNPHDDTIQALDYQIPQGGGRGGLPWEKTLGAATDHGPGGTGTQPRDEVEYWEIHARFATEGTSESDIVVEYHLPTRTIIRATYLRYHHGRRPYEKAVYFPTEGFYGIGVCEQKEMFQQYESDLMNFQHDNVLLSNALGIAAKQGSNIAPGEPIYPGKIWITDGNPKEELMPFQLGTVYQALPQLISAVQYTGRQRTGVSDLNSGNIQSLPSRTPATTVQSLLEEGARRPDLTLKDLRRCLSIVGLRVIQLIQQHANPTQNAEGEKFLQAALTVLGDEAGMELLSKLALPLENAEYGLGINLTATSATANKEVMKQSMMGLLQLQMQAAPAFIQQMQLATQMWGTPVGQVALDMSQGMAYTLKRLMETFDIRNLNEVVPVIPKDPVQSITDPTAALQLLPPGSGQPPGAPPAGGMEAPAGPMGAGSPAGV